MLKGVARREFDMVAAWSVDRLGRSLQDLIEVLSDLHAKAVDLYQSRHRCRTRPIQWSQWRPSSLCRRDSMSVRGPRAKLQLIIPGAGISLE